MQPCDRRRRAAVPQPARVRYNDWRQVALPPTEEFTPSLPVSVVMPSYRTPAAVLARTLAALEGQTYPRDLFEVVIVDDGSEPPLAAPRSPLDVRVVRRERRSYRVGTPRARNTGVRAAAHGIILCLESDMLAEAGWMAAHARWHHAVSDAVTVGLRAHVAVDDVDAQTIRGRPGTLRELFADRPCDPPWVEAHLRRTCELTAPTDDLFHVLVGGNFGISREFYRTLGGSDESFVRWGIEDQELAYRAATRGGLLVPVRAAFAWHQGRWAEGRAAKERSLRFQREKAAHLIAHPRFRRPARGRSYAVPRYVVTIDAGRGPVEQAAASAASILAGREHDLVVRIEVDGSDPSDGSAGAERLEWLRAAFGPDPRVLIAPARSALDQFPAAPFHVTLPAGVVARDLVPRLHARLGSAVLAAATLPDGGRVSIARAWALHRARRAGGAPADYGDVRELAPAWLQRPSAGHPGGAFAARWRRLLARVRR